MIDRTDFYIVYDPSDMRVAQTFYGCMKAYGVAEAKGLKCINRTHPANKEVLPSLVWP